MFKKPLRISVTKYAKKTKVISDILDHIIQTVHYNIQNINYIKFDTCLNSQKKSKPFVFTLQLKFSRVYTINKLNQVFNFKLTFLQKFLEFLNVNITLPLLKNLLFSNETEITVIFFDQLNNIDLFAALTHLSYTPVITNTKY